MGKGEIGPLNFTLEHLLKVKIKGIGVSCIAHLKQFWSSFLPRYMD
jgi:hypothetical protein